MKETAKRAALATLVVGGIVVAALALWKLKLVVALFFFAIIVAAAMRPGIEWLTSHGVPRGVGLLLHYLGLFALAGLFLWIVVPRAVGQVQSALGAETKARRLAVSPPAERPRLPGLFALDRQEA